ncbi:hypothetical protein B0H21DRAFT_705158 [Amylocystis lapponica]|nr:hypothetical protein B0H21DRAFT_705158 [Amylocystis lapponica]
MHRALDIPDIVYEIFRHLRPFPGRSRSDYQLRVLANAARTCRAFTDPALDLLWQDLDTIIYLLNVTHVVGPLYLIKIHGQCDRISDNEWMRFQYYARRVRCLSPHGAVRIDDSVFIELSRHTNGNSLLPSLEYLKWTAILSSQISTLSLIGPSLRRLDLRILPEALRHDEEPPDDDDLSPLLCQVFAQAPFIQELTISACGRPASYLSVTEAKHLRFLDIMGSYTTFSDPAVVHAFSNMESLTNLRVTLDEAFTPSSCSGFSNLQCLEIGGPLLQIAQLLSMINSRRLLSITVVSRTKADLVQCLAPCAKFTSLRTVKCYIDRFENHIILSRRLSDLIKVFLPMRDLESLELRVLKERLAWSDADVLEMASAWRRLTTLVLVHSHGNDSEIPPIWSLRHFARLCPNLTQLHLSIMDIQTPGPLPVDAAPVSEHALESLFIDIMHKRQGPVAELEAFHVAKFLDLLFPHVKWLNMRGVSEWGTVLDQVIEMQRERLTNGISA